MPSRRVVGNKTTTRQTPGHRRNWASLFEPELQKFFERCVDIVRAEDPRCDIDPITSEFKRFVSQKLGSNVGKLCILSPRQGNAWNNFLRKEHDRKRKELQEELGQVPLYGDVVRSLSVEWGSLSQEEKERFSVGEDREQTPGETSPNGTPSVTYDSLALQKQERKLRKHIKDLCSVLYDRHEVHTLLLDFDAKRSQIESDVEVHVCGKDIREAGVAELPSMQFVRFMKFRKAYPGDFKVMIQESIFKKQAKEDLKAMESEKPPSPTEQKRREFRSLIIQRFNDFVAGTDLANESIPPGAFLKPNFFSKYLDAKNLILRGIEDYKTIQKIQSLSGQQLDLYIAGLKSGEILFERNNDEIQMDLDLDDDVNFE